MNKQKQQRKTVDDLIHLYAHKEKAPIAYWATAFLITVLLGIISLTGLNAYVSKTLQLTTFVGLGILHVFLLNKNILFPHRIFLKYTKLLKDNKLNFSVFLALLMTVALMLLYLIIDSNMIRMAFASGCAFLFPFIIQQAWDAYINFPQKQYKIWYNSDGVMDTRTTIYLNSVPIRLRLAMKYFDIKDEVFELTVAGHTQFGKFFNQFVIEKNKNNVSAIECVDTDKKVVGWQFYVERLGGLYKQFIDPELSLRENNVKDHSTITAKRTRVAQESPKENLQATELKKLPHITQNKPLNKYEAKK